jgi:hypothetical protein
MDSGWISAFSAVMGSLVWSFYFNTIQQIVESYRRPKMTEEDIRRGAYLEIKDPVKEFGEASRKELNQLYRAAS